MAAGLVIDMVRSFIHECVPTTFFTFMSVMVVPAAILRVDVTVGVPLPLIVLGTSVAAKVVQVGCRVVKLRAVLYVPVAQPFTALARQ